MWFGEFKRKYKWLPEHEAAMKKSFDHKASEAYSNAMYRVRNKTDAGTWIPKKYLEELKVKWAEEDWQKKAKTNSINRNSSDGCLHTGGSIPTTEHYQRLKDSSGEIPTCWELFEKTHKMKGVASKWVSSKSERIADEYGSRILERDSQEAIGDGVSSEQSDNDIFLEVVGGVSKKRISGLGPAGENYVPSSTQSTGISVSEYTQMKSLISNLTAENQSLREQMLANQKKSDAENQHLREKMSEVHANQEKMLKFMEAFSQSHPPPPSNEDGQQNDDEYYDELHG